jgi:hypothetical protein
MTSSDLVCICIGLTLNSMTFILGVAVGVSLVKRRKDSENDRDNRARYEAEGFRYFPQDSKG